MKLKKRKSKQRLPKSERVKHCPNIVTSPSILKTGLRSLTQMKLFGMSNANALIYSKLCVRRTSLDISDSLSGGGGPVFDPGILGYIMWEADSTTKTW